MTLSIIIPTLNEEKVLEQTLRSLHHLSVVDYEIIVSDGASTDQTVAIARSRAHQVVVHEGRHKQNIAQGRNLGASRAGGEIFVFMDADVLIPEINDFFERTLELFARQDGLVALTVFLKVVPERVTLSDKLFFGVINRLYQFSNNVLHLGAASGEFQMIRAESFKKIGGYNPALTVGEDNDIFARLSKIGATKVETGLHVFHTSRRVRNLGWPRLLFLWTVNFIFLKIFRRSFSKVWEVVR